MNFPFRAPFFLSTLIAWIAENAPIYVGMNDGQYAYYCQIVRYCPKDVNGVPIRFLDAPETVVQ